MKVPGVILLASSYTDHVTQPPLHVLEPAETICNTISSFYYVGSHVCVCISVELSDASQPLNSEKTAKAGLNNV